MKTAKQLVNDCVSTHCEPNTPQGLIAYAYLMGRESATRTICDEHNRRTDLMRVAARAEHCHHVANRVLDAAGGDMIGSGDYAGDITLTFGGDLISETLADLIDGWIEARKVK